MNSTEKKRLGWKANLGIALIAIYSIYLLIGFFILPRIARSAVEENVAEILGRSVQVGNIAFNPFVLSVEVLDLVVADDWDGELVRCGRIYGNAQLFASIFGTVTIKEFQLEDTTIRVQRDQEGALSFGKLLDLASAESEETGTESGEIPALRVGLIGLSNISMIVDDAVPAMDFNDVFTLESLTIHELDTRPREDAAPLKIEAVISETAKFTAEANIASVQPLAVDWAIALTDFDLSIVRPYLAEFVEAEINGIADFALKGEISLPESGLQVSLSSDTLGRIRGLSVFDLTHHNGLLELQEVALKDFKANSSDMSFAVGLDMVEPIVRVVRLQDGAIAIPALFFEESSSDATKEEADPAEPIDINAWLTSLSLKGARIELRDLTLENMAEIVIDNLDTSLADLGYGRLYADEVPAQLSGGFDIGNAQGRIDFSGSLDAMKQAVNLSLKGSGVQLSTIQPYISEYSNAFMQSGGAAFDLAVEAVNGEDELDLKASGNLSVTDLKVGETGKTDTIVSYEKFLVEDAKYDGSAIDIAQIKLVKPAAFLGMDEAGVNLNRLLKSSPENEADTAEVAAAEIDDAAVEAELPLIRIGRIVVENGMTNLVDRTVTPAFSSSIDDFNLSIDELSTNSETVSKIAASARIDKTGTFSVEGEMRLLNPTEQARITMRMQGIDLTTGSPFSAKFVGRKIDKGQLTITSDVVISEGKLRNDNNLRIESFTFGEKVQSPDAIKVPVGLAVAVMQDANGVIAQNIPVRGDLTEPGVDKGALIMQAIVTAFTNIIVKAVTSPFKMLAGLAGGSDDIDYLEFDGGEITLDTENVDKMRVMSEILTKRPKIKLEISSSLIEGAEKEALRKRLLAFALRQWDGVSGDFSLDTAQIEDPVRQLYSEYDESGLAKRLETAYQSGLFHEEADEVEAVEPSVEVIKKSENVPTKSETSPAAAAPRKKKIPLVSFIKKTLGGSDSGRDTTAEVAGKETESNAANEKLNETGASEASDAFDFESVLSKAMESIDDSTMNSDWIDSLARSRMLIVKEAFITTLGVDTNRIFISAGPGDTSSGVADGRETNSSLVRFSATD